WREAVAGDRHAAGSRAKAPGAGRAGGPPDPAREGPHPRAHTGQQTRARDATGELIQAISREHSTLVVEHDMEFVRQFAHTVTVLHGGKVLCEGPFEQVQADERVVEVYLGRGKIHAA